MESQKIISLLDNTPNKPSKFRTKNLVEINDDSHETYNTNSETKFETSILKSSLRDYKDVYIYVNGAITAPNTAAAVAAANNGNNKATFKNRTPLTD